MMRKGNNCEFKEIEEPERFKSTDGKNIYFGFPTSMFPNIAPYIIVAQYHDESNNIIPVHFSIIRTSETGYTRTGQFNGTNSSASTIGSDIIGIGVQSSSPLFNIIPTWIFEKGFIYEYK